jgi:adenylate cyclase
MAEVEHGHIGTQVGAYERSQIGRLQTGFNRMVAGLAERDRVRDLFGRHVGSEVAQRAIQEGASLSGDVVEVGVLFIDLVGSTQLAESLPPQEVAEVLNDFFRIVVDAVDAQDGLINKFQGDAALAIFGAPIEHPDASGGALAAARELHDELLPVIGYAEFGIGVSAGRAIAGHIGAQARFEYTVIGDPVNEAARLTELAKERRPRVLASERAVRRAAPDEAGHWELDDEVSLRGRAEPTRLATPVESRVPAG